MKDDQVPTNPAEEVLSRVDAFVHDEESGIPQLVRQAAEQGMTVEASVSTRVTVNVTDAVLRNEGIDLDATENSLRISTENSLRISPEELVAAHAMGFTDADVIAMRRLHHATVEEFFTRRIREAAPTLSKRMRNWLCGYVQHNYPDLGVEFPVDTDVSEAALQAEAEAAFTARTMNPLPSLPQFFASRPYLNTDEAWKQKVEDILAAALPRPDWVRVLGNILGNILRIQHA